MFLKIFRNFSCVRAASNNVAAFCQRRATSQDTMLPPQCGVVLPGLKFVVERTEEKVNTKKKKVASKIYSVPDKGQGTNLVEGNKTDHQPRSGVHQSRYRHLCPLGAAESKTSRSIRGHSELFGCFSERSAKTDTKNLFRSIKATYQRRTAIRGSDMWTGFSI